MPQPTVRRILPAAALAACALAVCAGAVVGDDAKNEAAARIASARGEYRAAPTQPVARGAGAAAGVRAAAVIRPGVKLQYRAAAGTVEPGAWDGIAMKCPSRYPRAIGGGLDSGAPAVVLSSSTPVGETQRQWGVGVTNVGTAPSQWTAILVCAK